MDSDRRRGITCVVCTVLGMLALSLYISEMAYAVHRIFFSRLESIHMTIGRNVCARKETRWLNARHTHTRTHTLAHTWCLNMCLVPIISTTEARQRQKECNCLCSMPAWAQSTISIYTFRHRFIFSLWRRCFALKIAQLVKFTHCVQYEYATETLYSFTSASSNLYHSLLQIHSKQQQQRYAQQMAR